MEALLVEVRSDGAVGRRGRRLGRPRRIPEAVLRVLWVLLCIIVVLLQLLLLFVGAMDESCAADIRSFALWGAKNRRMEEGRSLGASRVSFVTLANRRWAL